MVKNINYDPKITLSKGLKQAVAVLSSTGFTVLIVAIMRCVFNKEFKLEEIQGLINGFTGLIMVIVPVISSAVTMINNFRKHYHTNIK